MGKVEIQAELKELNSLLSKTKGYAKKNDIDFMVYQPYIDILNKIKKNKKKLLALDIKRMEVFEQVVNSVNDNGRTKYFKY